MGSSKMVNLGFIMVCFSYIKIVKKLYILNKIDKYFKIIVFLLMVKHYFIDFLLNNSLLVEFFRVITVKM